MFFVSEILEWRCTSDAEAVCSVVVVSTNDVLPSSTSSSSHDICGGRFFGERATSSLEQRSPKSPSSPHFNISSISNQQTHGATVRIDWRHVSTSSFKGPADDGNMSLIPQVEIVQPWSAGFLDFSQCWELTLCCCPIRNPWPNPWPSMMQVAMFMVQH